MALDSEDDIISRIMLILGDPDEDLITETVIEAFLTVHESTYPIDTDPCRLTYMTLLSCFDYITKQLLKNGEGIGGAAKSEKEYGIEYSESYTGQYGLIDYWDRQKADFMANPDEYLPCLSKYASGIGMIKIGGVRKSEVIANDMNDDLLQWDSPRRRRPKNIFDAE